MFLENKNILMCVEDKCEHYMKHNQICNVVSHRVSKSKRCVLSNEINTLRNTIEIYKRDLRKVELENQKEIECLCDTCIHKNVCSGDLNSIGAKLGLNDNVIKCIQYRKDREIVYYKLNNTNY